MDFDYVALLSIASIIAGIGLATNNTVAIVASMLVSPIMGPVMACTFGTIVHKWSLVQLGAVSELLSLLLCCVIGFFIGMVAIGTGTGGSWPTPEMRSRGKISIESIYTLYSSICNYYAWCFRMFMVGLVDGLAIGLAIAIPSGMGVALSILGNNTSSLVGVAISASLLPPAVNFGMCLAYAACGFELDQQANNDGSYTNGLSYAGLGSISLALTIVNIGAIYVSGCLMFRLKEVAPLKDKQAFWERDTLVFRRLMNSDNRGASPSAPGELPFSPADLEAQVRMLREVGRNRDLRSQLNVATDDALLGLASGSSLVPNGGMFSPMGARRPKSIRLPQKGGILSGSVDDSLLPSTSTYAALSPRKGKTGPEARSSALLELYRRGEPSTELPVPVDTSTVRTAPANLFSNTGYSAYSSTGPGVAPSVALVGHVGTAGSTGVGKNTPTMDLSAVKERLRERGRTYHVSGEQKSNRKVG